MGIIHPDRGYASLPSAAPVEPNTSTREPNTITREPAVEAGGGASRKRGVAGARSGGGASAGGPPPRFFHVAIDCPGYGRTPGDCQSIRSYPSQVLTQVIQALGKKHAYAVIGSSQGMVYL